MKKYLFGAAILAMGLSMVGCNKSVEADEQNAGEDGLALCEEISGLSALLHD